MEAFHIESMGHIIGSPNPARGYTQPIIAKRCFISILYLYPQTVTLQNNMKVTRISKRPNGFHRTSKTSMRYMIVNSWFYVMGRIVPHPF